MTDNDVTFTVDGSPTPLNACPICGAVIPRIYWDRHGTWHTTIKDSAIKP